MPTQPQPPSQPALSPELREHIRKLVADAPPLTEQQRNLIAALFRPLVRSATGRTTTTGPAT